MEQCTEEEINRLKESLTATTRKMEQIKEDFADRSEKLQYAEQLLEKAKATSGTTPQDWVTCTWTDTGTKGGGGCVETFTSAPLESFTSLYLSQKNLLQPATDHAWT